MIWRVLGLLGLTGALFAAGAFFYSAEISRLLAGEGYRFEAVSSQVSAERGQEFSIRLIGPDGAAVENADISRRPSRHVARRHGRHGFACHESPVRARPAFSPTAPTSRWPDAGHSTSRLRCPDGPSPSSAKSF